MKDCPSISSVLGVKLKRYRSICIEKMSVFSIFIGFLLNGLILYVGDTHKDIVYSRNEQEDDRTVVLCRAKSFDAQVVRPNAVYVIKHCFNLNGKSLVIPEGCSLVFDGGELKNGLLVGHNTQLVYNKAFLNQVKLAGDFYTDKIPVDTEIFKDSKYNTNRIESMMCIFGKDGKLVFSCNTYNEVETINLNRDVDIDFSGSRIKLKLEKDGLPHCFIYTSEKQVEDNSFLAFFRMKNAIIVGNEEFEYDGTVWPSTLHFGSRRRCIQLFKVNEVELDNVHFEHIEAGTAGVNNQNTRERYERSIVAIMYYNRARINGCVLHDCFGDNLLRLVPNTTPDNMAIVSNCYSYRNFTGLVIIKDGRCKVFGNRCYGFNSSAMNLFVYDSDIYDNYFEDSLRSDCIDLSEGGPMVVHDVNIYNNTGINIGVLCSVCGERINVFNNYAETKWYSALVRVDGVRKMNPSLVNNNRELSSNRTAWIHNNVIKGGGIVTSIVSSDGNTSSRYIDSIIIEQNKCEKESEVDQKFTHPILLFNCKEAIIRGNLLKGFSRSPAGRSSASIICSYNVLNKESPFSCTIYIYDNDFVYDKGRIGNNVHRSVYLLRNNVEDKNFSVNVVMENNRFTGTDHSLKGVYISGGVGQQKIRVMGNNGIVEAD